MRRADLCRMITWCALGLAVAVGPADAQTTETESWQFALTVYGYLPARSGAAYFPVPGTGASFNLNQSDLISSLKMTRGFCVRICISWHSHLGALKLL